MVVPGGVDRSGRERVIPALLWLVERVAREHELVVVALGQEPEAGRWPLLGATVVNVPPERHGAARLVRQMVRAVRATGAQGRPDVVVGLWASTSGLAAGLAARRHRVPCQVHVAGGELVALDHIGYGGARGRGGRLIGRTALRLADDVTAASRWLVDEIAPLGHHVDAIVPLGADRTVFAPRPDGPRATTATGPRLVHVASLNRVKDQTTLLHAVARARRALPGLVLDCIGVDTLDGAVQRLAAELGLAEAVRFHGYVPWDELAPWYQQADLHLITSIHEAGPLALVEAACCGVPTAGTRVGHLADLAAADPPAAVAVDVGDAAALAEVIVALCTDHARRRALGEAAHAWAVAHDADATAAAFVARWDQLVAGRSRSN